MFEKELQSKIQAIFKPKRTDFWKDNVEQDVAFIKITQANVHVTEGKQRGRASGTVTIFADQDRMKHGYFQRALANADLSLTRNLSFFNLDQSLGVVADLDSRSCEFIYFFEMQYDPEQGLITELNQNIEVIP